MSSHWSASATEGSRKAPTSAATQAIGCVVFKGMRILQKCAAPSHRRSLTVLLPGIEPGSLGLDRPAPSQTAGAETSAADALPGRARRRQLGQHGAELRDSA